MNITKDLEDKICLLYKQGLSIRKISKNFNIYEEAISKTLKKNSIEVRSNRKFDKKQEKIICQEYINGSSASALSKKYKVLIHTILNCLKRNNIKIRNKSESIRKYNLNQNILDNINDQNVFWFLGWMWSDGCNYTNTNLLCVTTHRKDIDVLFKLKNILSSERPICHPKNKDCSILYFNSKKMSEKLNKLGCIPNKSLYVKYPEWIKSKENHASFLRGVFEGDGSISMRHKNSISLEISSGSLVFLESIGKILDKYFEIEYKIYEKKNSNSKRICICGKNENKLKFLDFIYEKSENKNRMIRKYEIYSNFKKNV